MSHTISLCRINNIANEPANPASMLSAACAVVPNNHSAISFHAFSPNLSGLSDKLLQFSKT
jgi:hypothetical protein